METEVCTPWKEQLPGLSLLLAVCGTCCRGVCTVLQIKAFRKDFMGFEVSAGDFGSSVRSEGRMVLLWGLVVV